MFDDKTNFNFAIVKIWLFFSFFIFELNRDIRGSRTRVSCFGFVTFKTEFQSFVLQPKDRRARVHIQEIVCSSLASCACRRWCLRFSLVAVSCSFLFLFGRLFVGNECAVRCGSLRLQLHVFFSVRFCLCGFFFLSLDANRVIYASNANEWFKSARIVRLMFSSQFSANKNWFSEIFGSDGSTETLKWRRTIIVCFVRTAHTLHNSIAWWMWCVLCLLWPKQSKWKSVSNEWKQITREF